MIRWCFIERKNSSFAGEPVLKLGEGTHTFSEKGMYDIILRPFPEKNQQPSLKGFNKFQWSSTSPPNPASVMEPLPEATPRAECGLGISQKSPTR